MTGCWCFNHLKTGFWLKSNHHVYNQIMVWIWNSPWFLGEIIIFPSFSYGFFVNFWGLPGEPSQFRRGGTGPGPGGGSLRLPRQAGAGGATARGTVGHGKSKDVFLTYPYGYGSIPINTIFSGMNIHLPAILGFTRGTRFWPTAICQCSMVLVYLPTWLGDFGQGQMLVCIFQHHGSLIWEKEKRMGWSAEAALTGRSNVTVRWR